MFKRCNIIKKASSILMAAIVFSTSAMTGYAVENPEKSGVDDFRGGVLNL